MKTILVTGVSRGLGLTLAKSILARGWTVYGTSRTTTPDLDALLANYPDHFFWQAADLSQPEAAAAGLFAKEFIATADVALDGLVNNAAMAYDDLITNLDTDRLEALYRLNVFAPMLLARYAIRNMLYHNRGGSLVHISSISAHTGYKGLAFYGSTKGALEAFSKNAAREWGARKIRSNTVAPGFMDTAMSAPLGEESRQRIHRRSSLGEPVEIESVASAILYLLSDEAASVTGQNLIIDAGSL